MRSTDEPESGGMIRTPDAMESYLAAFTALETRGGSAGPAWLRERRQQAVARFRELGFPSPREEDWRHTNVAPIATARFAPFSDEIFEQLDPAALESFAPGDETWTRLVFVNGRFSSKLSSRGALPSSVRVTSLAEALVTEAAALEAHLAAHACDGDAFTALNTGLFEDGAFVAIPEDVAAEAPIHLVFLVAARQPGVRAMAQPRTLIVAGPRSRATLVEHYVGLDRAVYFTNAVTEVVLQDGAFLEHYKVQEESLGAYHVGVLQLAHGRDTGFTSSSIALGGQLVRNTLRVLFEAEGGACTLNGLYLVGGRQHVDNHVTVDHARPRCTSRQLYKGILDGTSRGVFNGRIIVRRDAQKTDAHQTNKNLLLADGPQVNSKPWLEIFANDVKCTHGAADGQLAEEALFYLRSRGLCGATARTLLTYGFANEVIKRVRIEPLRTYVERRLLSRLVDGRVTEGAV